MGSWNNEEILGARGRSHPLRVTPQVLTGIERMEYFNKRNILFFLLTIVAGYMAYSSLRGLFTLSFPNDYYSHIILIPLISGYFLYLKRKDIFLNSEYPFPIGLILVLAGVTLYLYGRMLEGRVNQNDYSSLLIVSVIFFWYGAFIFFYGTQGFRVAIFPLLFLAFMIPIPSVLMEKVIYLLQLGSAEVSYLLFGLTGTPVSKEAFIFHLPGLNIEVAKQCSGIRSSLALFITSILAGQFFLQTGWKRIILILSVAPLAILKNGIRIVTLSLLGIYVDEKFITQGFLHKSGGFVFFIPSLILLGMILLLLRKSERA